MYSCLPICHCNSTKGLKVPNNDDNQKNVEEKLAASLDVAHRGPDARGRRLPKDRRVG